MYWAALKFTISLRGMVVLAAGIAVINGDAARAQAVDPIKARIEIDGRRYLWRDLVALRRAQATPAVQQPALFILRDDHRPAGERDAAERYREPSLFTALERSR